MSKHHYVIEVDVFDEILKDSLAVDHDPSEWDFTDIKLAWDCAVVANVQVVDYYAPLTPEELKSEAMTRVREINARLRDQDPMESGVLTTGLRAGACGCSMCRERTEEIASMDSGTGAETAEGAYPE